MGASGEGYERIRRIAAVGMELILGNLRAAVADREDEAFTALGLGTDLGGYAIMVGGTNGPHLGSFSLVDVLTHGRACAILYPYYTAFFAEEIQDQLSTIAPILERTGLIEGKAAGLSGKALGEAVAKGMMRFNGSLGFPTTLREAGATEGHLSRMLEAAKNPQLRMKLMNMPVPMDPEAGDVERYMAGVLKAAYTGDLKHITTKKK
jgi:alcohol dehydrogenase